MTKHIKETKKQFTETEVEEKDKENKKCNNPQTKVEILLNDRN